MADAEKQVDAVIDLVKGMDIAAPAAAEGKKDELSVDEKVEMLMSVMEEVVKPEELRELLTKHPRPRAYDGFEPSGRMHIAQGVLKSILVNRMTACGIEFVFWVADWFAMLNNKLGADMKKIQTCGEYLVEVWKAAGMDLENVTFLWAQEEIAKDPTRYWGLVLDISRKFTVNRIKRCGTIMGRAEADDMPAAQIMYPCMQAADIFYLKANIAQLGMDQRKVNMLAREYAGDKKIAKKQRIRPPIIMSHHMLMGLKQGQAKMSKSDPDSAIFMEDAASDVKRKIKSAYCPPGVVEANPCLDYTKWIVFNKFPSLTVTRSEENGGDREYKSYDELEEDYAAGNLHPSDLKKSLTAAINEILEPVRKHFASGRPAELLKKVRSFKVTK